jgi:hypothetical protein
VIDPQVGLAEVDPDPPARVPGQREVRAELERLVDRRRAGIELADHIGERLSSAGKRNGVILAQFDRPVCKARGCGNLLLLIVHPAAALAPDIAIGSHSISGREFGIDFSCTNEQRQCAGIGRGCRLMHVRQPPQQQVIGVESFGLFPPRALDLRLLHLRCDRAHHARRHLILQLEDVVQLAFEPFSPKMGARGRIDELSGNPDLVGRLADAALEDVSHAELEADAADVDRLSFVDEAGVPGDHEQPADP